MLSIRLTASPALGVGPSDAFRRHAAQSLLACTSDRDVNLSVLAMQTQAASLTATAHALLEIVGAGNAAGRTFRLEVQDDAQDGRMGDDSLRAIAVDAHGILSCPVYVATRQVPVSQWASVRPLRWDRNGLAAGNAAPTLPFGGSACNGLALEFGGKTLLATAKLVGVALGAREQERIAQAVGGPSSGFVDAAATPVGQAPDGGSLFVIELGDPRRTPLHRVLAVMEIEASRYGARLGCGALLSDAPLALFTSALAQAMGLAVRQEQVIETHLPSERSGVTQS